MRDIKFRCWDTKHKEFTRRLLQYGVDGSLKAEPFGILQQYTGLKDIEKKEIYENDIVFDGKEYNYSIHYGPHALWIMSMVPVGNWKLGEGPWRPLWQDYVKIKIIGNTMENPELLDAK